MTPQTHRLVFNKSRGCLIAVGENARSSSGGCSGTRRGKRRLLNNQTIDTSQDGELKLAGSTNTTQTSHTEKTTTAGVYQEMSGYGETSQTYNQTQINGQVTIATGIRTTVLIPEGDLKKQVEALSQQPGQAYIAELAKDPRINWQQVKLAYDKWDYSQAGLTPAGAALLAIAVAVASGGSAAGLVQSWGFTGPMAASMTAGMTAMASSAAVSFVNNGGDIGKTLKDMGSSQNIKGIALAMVSAGALSELNASLGLDKVRVTDGFQANLNKAIINNLANATMTSAITGTPLEDNIKTGLVSAFISAGAGSAAFEIGEKTANDQMAKALAHAIAGCVAGAAGQGKGGCSAGATGAVVGELAAQWYDPNGTKKPEDTLNFVKVVTAAVAAITGDGSAASVSTAVMTGVNAAQNNYLRHAEAIDLANAKSRQALCSDNACLVKEQDVIDALLLKSYERDLALQNACSGAGAGGNTCLGLMNDAKQAWASYSGKSSTVLDPVVAEQAAAAKRAYYYPSYAVGGTSMPRTTGAMNGMLKALGGVAAAPMLIANTAVQALGGDEQALQSLKAMVVDAAVTVTNIPAAVQKQLDAATAAETHGDKQAAAEIYAELATNTVLVTSAITKVVGSASNVLGKNGALLTPAEVASSNVSGSLGKLGGSFDAVTPGPLADNLAATFAGGKYREVTLTKDTVLFRAGSTDNPLGQFFVNEKPAGVIQSRIDSAILPNWPGGGTSPIDAVFAVNIPAGTKVYVGAAGSQGSFYVGGTTQIVVEKPWAITGVAAQKIGPLK